MKAAIVSCQLSTNLAAFSIALNSRERKLRATAHANYLHGISGDYRTE